MGIGLARRDLAIQCLSACLYLGAHLHSGIRSAYHDENKRHWAGTPAVGILPHGQYCGRVTTQVRHHSLRVPVTGDQQ